MRIALTGAVVLAFACTFAAGQTQSVDDRLRQLEAETTALPAEVARLRQANLTTTAPADTTADLLKEIDADAASRSAVIPRKPADMNPSIAVIGDFRGNVSTNSDNPARNRFDQAAVELDFRAAVAPIADA